MQKINEFAGLAIVALLVLAPMPNAAHGALAGGKPTASRLKGMKSAIADLEKGVLKQKEYPPLPYPPGYQNFIRLLKSECGVDWEVISSLSDSKELREEVEGYNGVMRAEIEHRFGHDIFEKLRGKSK